MKPAPASCSAGRVSKIQMASSVMVQRVSPAASNYLQGTCRLALLLQIPEQLGGTYSAYGRVPFQSAFTGTRLFPVEPPCALAQVIPCGGVPVADLAVVSYSGFQTVHTLPTRSGPGFSVGLPGCQPDGVTSPVARTCWKAFSCRSSSSGFRPTSGVRTSIARMMKSGSMMNRPRMSTPAASSYTPYTEPIFPPGSESIGKGTPPGTILESSSSCQILWTKRLSVLTARTSASRALISS